jgi:hypothetical protein
MRTQKIAFLLILMILVCFTLFSSIHSGKAHNLPLDVATPSGVEQFPYDPTFLPTLVPRIIKPQIAQLNRHYLPLVIQ